MIRRRQRPAASAARTAARPAVRPARQAAAAAGALLALVGLAGPAAAHDELSGTTPADGASVEVPPAAIELTFTEPPLSLGSQVQVTGPDGDVVNAGELQIVDTVVSQPLASDLPAGEYAIAWRVTSSDGHPISGQLAFTALAGSGGAEEPATPEPTPTDLTTATPEPEAPTAAPEPTTEPGPGAPAPDAGGTVDEPAAGATPWVVGAVIVVLVGGTLWWVSRRRGAPGPQG